MDWYSLFVITGKEELVVDLLHFYLSGYNFDTLIPKRKLFERKAGNINQVLREMFPGYVLINIDMNSETYYTLKKVPNLIRVLNSDEYYTKIPNEEINCIRQLLGEGDIIDISKVQLINSRVTVKSGPLKGKEALIKSVDIRKRRAKITLKFMGLIKVIDVSIEVLSENIENTS